MKLGRTVGIIIYMCEPLFSTLKAVVMDSGFCAANIIVAFATKGVYAGALIKKRGHLPKSFPWDIIDRNF